jgi:predicted transcriptional regulator
MKNYDKFIRAFSDIETQLKRIVDVDIGERVDFSILLNRTKSKSRLVQSIYKDLKGLAKIRNFLVHELEKKDAIELSDETIKQIEKFAALLMNPPKVDRFFQNNIVYCNVYDSVDSVLYKMKEHDFSQVPVYNGIDFFGLLTTNTVARWLTEQLTKNGIINHEDQINQVMLSEEYTDNYQFVDRNINLFDIAEIFKNNLKSTTKLDAILITETGKSSQKLLGIITWYDLSRIYKELSD